jgi:predicted aspartyl protease
MEVSRPARLRQTDLEVTARALILGAIAALSVSGTARAADCRLQNIASLDATRGPDGLLTVPVSMGSERVNMLLDTGAERGVIDISVTRKMGITPLKIYTPPPIFNVPGAPFRSMVQFSHPDFYLTDGTKLDHFVKVPAVNIGASHTESVIFLLARFDDAQAHGAKGILGSNLLRNFDVEVDPAAAKVNLFSPDHCENKVVYWAPAYADLPLRIGSGGQIEFTMSLDGRDVDAVLDTGAAQTTLNIAMARRAFGIDLDAPTVERVSGEGSNTIYRTRFQALAAGGLTIKNPQITLAPDRIARQQMARALDSGASGSGVLDSAKLVLGMDILNRLHFYIAYREKKLYFTAAAPAH